MRDTSGFIALHVSVNATVIREQKTAAFGAVFGTLSTEL
jgi:hypothetical protein